MNPVLDRAHPEPRPTSHKSLGDHAIAERIRNRDTALFGSIISETSEDDRRSLMAIHDAVASRLGEFSYLEIGSHLGGTLQTVVADPRCKRVVSIDPRPAWQADDRPEIDGWAYDGNSTERMLECLRAVPDADLTKLETVEASTEDLAPGRFTRPDLCFIDGEHTYAAALRDTRFCRTVLQGAGVIMFHDIGIVSQAVVDFLRETPGSHRGYWLRSTLFVLELGAVPSMLQHPGVRSQLYLGPRGWVVANNTRQARRLLATIQLSRGLKHRLAEAVRGRFQHPLR
jgi:Methyltransferase domain